LTFEPYIDPLTLPFQDRPEDFLAELRTLRAQVKLNYRENKKKASTKKAAKGPPRKTKADRLIADKLASLPEELREKLLSTMKGSA
jgi:hypothetical protein